jgi:hypothetical protein
MQCSAKNKKLNPDNGGKYVNKEMTTFSEIKIIIQDLSPPYAHKSNSLPEHMNPTIVTMVRSMTFDDANMIPPALWAEGYSTAVHIKNRLLYSAFQLKKLPYEIMFGDKPSIKPLYPFGAKYYVHVPVEKQIGISKLRPRGIKCYVVGDMESSKILQLYNLHKCRVFTSRHVVVPDSTKRHESIEIQSLSDLPFDLDNDAPSMIEQERDFWEWIVNNFDDAIDWAKNGNPILRKFIRFCLHEDNLILLSLIRIKNFWIN